MKSQTSSDVPEGDIAVPIVFFTIHGGGFNNPRSAAIIAALQQRNPPAEVASFAFATTEEAKMVKGRSVALFDGYCKGEYTPLPPKSGKSPGWAASSTYVVTVSSKVRAACCAHQILAMFTVRAEVEKKSGRMPWGSLPDAEARGRRRRKASGRYRRNRGLLDTGTPPGFFSGDHHGFG